MLNIFWNFLKSFAGLYLIISFFVIILLNYFAVLGVTATIIVALIDILILWGIIYFKK
jgi:hypothetical protein